MRHGSGETMKKTHLSVIIAAVMIFSLIPGGCSDAAQNSDESFRLLVCTENRDMEDMIRYFCRDNNISIRIEYKNILQTAEILNTEDCPFDGVWLSDSFWLNTLDSQNLITDAKSVSINPVVFAVKKSKAQKLGFTKKKITMTDITDRIKSGELTFILPAQPHSDIGISAYLRFFYIAAQNPAMLTDRYLKDEKNLYDMKRLLAGIERVQVSDENLIETFLSGSYDAAAGYEFDFITANKKLIAEGKEPLQLIYPADGIFLCDSPFAYIDKNDSSKHEIFVQLQNFLLSEEMQKEMAQSGRRTGYGGENPYGSEAVFNPAWGIDMNAYLPQLSWPRAETVRSFNLLLNTRLRKPSVTILLLDNPLDNKNNSEVMDNSVKYMLNYRNGDKDYIQLYNHDIVYMTAFGNRRLSEFSAAGTESEILKKELEWLSPTSSYRYGWFNSKYVSDLYEPLFFSLDILKKYNSREYSFTIVLFTDEKEFAAEHPDRSEELAERFADLPQDTKVFIISVADYSEAVYQPIISATNGKLYNARGGMASVFKEIRRNGVSD